MTMHTTILRAALAIVLTIPALAPAAEFRTWSDASGRFSVKAKFVSLDGENVTLEKEDGSQIEVPLKKLKLADQKAARAAAKDADNPFKPAGGDDPFKTKTPPATGGDREPAEATINWASVRSADPTPASGDWKVAVAAPRATPREANRPVPLPPKAQFFEQTKGLAVNPAGTRAVVAYVNNDPRQQDTKPSRVVVVDLEAGKAIATFNVNGPFVPLAVNDAGTRVLMRRDEFGHGNADKVELWDVEGPTPRRLNRWAPNGDLKHANRDVKWAAFLADGRLVTAGGRLTVWEADPVKPVYSLMTQGGPIPAISPDGKLVAFTDGKHVGILDVAAEKVLATREVAEHLAFPVVAFSPSGKRLAVQAGQKLYAFDTATGEPYREMLLVNAFANGQLAWTDEDHVLLGGRTLYDLANQIKLWEYQGGDVVASTGGVCWFVTSEGEARPGALVPAKLPQPAVTAAVTKALGFFVLKPGVTVSIDTSKLPDGSEREKVEAALAAKLRANGCQVGSGGSIILEALTEEGKEREVTYRMFGAGFPREKKYKVKEHFTRVRFTANGQKVWESTAGSLPFFVHLGADETMEQHLKRYEQPNYKFYEHVELPKMLTKPTAGQQGLGTSRVSAAGVR
jgi:hypothetical protein